MKDLLISHTDLTIAKEDYQKLLDNKINFKVFDHHTTHLYAKSYPSTTIKVQSLL